MIIALPCEIRPAGLPNEPRRCRLIRPDHFPQRRGVIYRAPIDHGRPDPSRGRNELRPDKDDTVNMIGHNDERIQPYRWKPCRQFIPRRLCDVPGLGQLHFSVRHRAKHTGTGLCTGGHEIGPRLRAIVAPQPHRATVMLFRVILCLDHAHFHLPEKQFLLQRPLLQFAVNLGNYLLATPVAIVLSIAHGLAAIASLGLQRFERKQVVPDDEPVVKPIMIGMGNL